MFELVVTAWLGAQLVGTMPIHPRFRYGETCAAEGKRIVELYAHRAQNNLLSFEADCPRAITFTL